MENSNGLAVDATAPLSSSTAERNAALIMAWSSINKAGATLGADNGDDASAFVKELRHLGTAQHVAQKKTAPLMHAPLAIRTKAMSIKKRNWSRRSCAGARPSADYARRVSSA